ncbi:hypothetical protein B0H10DRAFT_2076669 [Mycena sp. CBHHK59/15]|nr:hypothetical protein B0H10DRAFT_2076669 [Mycena sp. CBHHK59/15]
MANRPKRPATSPGPPSLAPRWLSGTVSDDGGPLVTTPTLKKRHSTYTFTQPETAVLPVVPPRPPRNPARKGSGVPEKNPQNTKRPSTATGTREEVTPWEFFPVNAPTEGLPILTSDETAKQSSATATGKREDVLPWEMFPAPDYDAGGMDTPTKPVINGSHPQASHSRSARPSISSGSILSFQDMTLLRRRKSTGTKTPRPPTAPPVASSSTFVNGFPRASTSTNNASKSPSSSPKVLHKTPSASTVRPPLPKATSGPVPTLTLLNTPPVSDPQTPTQDPKFSTADRTILQELKRNISARAAQFVIKGGPVESGRAVTSMRQGTKHHAYGREEVPYPRSYAPEVLDLDVWETMACQKICDSLTWHVFTTPPTKVLDIGCGTGTWILNCGMAWRNCHFVGVDIVPLHPDLGSSELSTRITWVQANFLEGLPFPNDEFDFVHIKRIALGVPEDKWDALFEEIVRVMKPGGAFELIEEDLFFPGKSSDDDGDGDSDSDALSELRCARRDSLTSDSMDHEDDESVITGSGGSRISYDGSAPTPDTSLGVIPVTPPRTASPLPILTAPIREEVIAEAEEGGLVPKTAKPSALAAQPAHRHSYQQRAPPSTLGPGHATSRPASGSVTSLLGPGVSYSGSTLVSPSVYPANGTAKHSFAPFLLRTLPKAPPNPRDHSLLEGIYNEMNASRFINLSPLSLLANLVGLHFKDVRTHPPLQLTFPPPVAKPPKRRQSAMSSSFLSASSASSPRRSSFGEDSQIDEHRWVNTSDLVKRESRYISLDDARMSALSPSHRASFPRYLLRDPPSNASASSGGDAERLPNATLNIDMRSLNMHLAVRTTEVLACAESMWEWVVSFQKSARAQPVRRRARAGSLASEVGSSHAARLSALPPDPVAEGFNSADFDGLLVKFEMCFFGYADHMAIGSTLRDQFSWSCMLLAPSQERKWQDEQRRKRKSPYERHQTRSSINSMPDASGYEGGIPKAEVFRGRSSLPERASQYYSSSSSRRSPDRRLSRSIRVFAAWKP